MIPHVGRARLEILCFANAVPWCCLSRARCLSRWTRLTRRRLLAGGHSLGSLGAGLRWVLDAALAVCWARLLDAAYFFGRWARLVLGLLSQASTATTSVSIPAPTNVSDAPTAAVRIVEDHLLARRWRTPRAGKLATTAGATMTDAQSR